MKGSDRMSDNMIDISIYGKNKQQLQPGKIQFASMNQLEMVAETKMQYMKEYQGSELFGYKKDYEQKEENEQKKSVYFAKFFINDEMKPQKEVLENKKLDIKEKKHRSNLKKEITDELERLPDTDINKNRVVENEVKFIIETEEVNKRQENYKNELYKQYMKANKIKKIDDIEDDAIYDLNIMAKFYDHLEPAKDKQKNYIPESYKYTDKAFKKKYADKEFDNESLKKITSKELVSNREIIKAYISRYSFNHTMIEEFEYKYVRKNYTRSIQRLNEIKGLRDYVKKYGTDGLNLKYSKEDVVRIVDECEEMFRISLEVNGWFVETDSTNMNYQIRFRKKEIGAVSAADRKISEMKTMFTDLNIKSAKEKAEELLDKKFSNWSEENYQEELVRLGREDRIPEVKKLINETTIDGEHFELANRLFVDFQVNEKTIVFFGAQIHYLNELLEQMSVEVEDVMVQLEKKLSELEQKNEAIMKTNVLIQNTITNVVIGEEMTMEQKEYIHINKMSLQGDKQEVVRSETVKMLKIYKEVQESEIEALEQKELKIQIEEINKKIGIETPPLELLQYQKELYTLEKQLKGQDLSTWNAKENFLAKKIKIYAERVRVVALQSAFKKIEITEAELTVVEQQALGIVEGNPIDIKNVEAYAKKIYTMTQKQYMKDYADYVNAIRNEMQKEVKIMPMPEVGSPVFLENFEWLQEPLEDRKKKTVPKLFAEMSASVREILLTELERKNAYIKLQLILKNKDLEEKERTDAQIASQYLEIIEKLHYQNYSLFGNEKKRKKNGESANGDKIIRSVYDFYKVTNFANMSENEMFDMTSKMSKGVFENPEIMENDKKEEIRQTNRAGLNVYKKNLLAHYKKLYNKYGLEWKNQEEAVHIYTELLKDIPAVQVHSMLCNDLENFDFKNKDERMLYELILFYSSYLQWLDFGFGKFKSNIKAGNIETSKANNIGKTNIRLRYRYLKRHEQELKQ